VQFAVATGKRSTAAESSGFDKQSKDEEKGSI